MSELASVVADEFENVRGVAFEAKLVASLGLDCVVLVEQVLAWQIASLAANGQVNVGVRACVITIAGLHFDFVDDLVRAELPFFGPLLFLQFSKKKKQLDCLLK